MLLVDDSSRVSRDLADAVRLLQELKFAGVRVIYISQTIDSASEQAETLVAVHGVVDSLFLREMAKKIKRGLAGQLERGFATGSITFGYRTVAVPDPSGKTDVNGYPVLLGKRVEVEPTEARVIVQIFEWYAAGLGCGRILSRLHAERLPGPRGQRWKIGALKRASSTNGIRGQLIWGQRTHERRPGTRQKVVAAPAPRGVARARPAGPPHRVRRALGPRASASGAHPARLAGRGGWDPDPHARAPCRTCTRGICSAAFSGAGSAGTRFRPCMAAPDRRATAAASRTATA